MTENLPKRVLIIAYHFPPLTGGGVFRPLKFAKYLPEFGWQPIVLAAEPTPYDVLDETLLQQLPDSVIVHRVGHTHPQEIEKKLKPIWSFFWKLRLRGFADRVQPYKLMRWFFPDPYITWKKPALDKAKELIATYQPDIILTTSPPHSIQMLGLDLKKDSGLPWVVDFRDSWSGNQANSYPTEWHRVYARKQERVILEKANFTITTSGSILMQLLNKKMRDRCVVITNGYDEDDFYLSRDIPSKYGNLFRILYAGSLYGSQKADVFLKCIDEIVLTKQIPESKLRVDFIGKDGTNLLLNYDDRSWLFQSPMMSHSDVLDRMQQSDVLLLILSNQLKAHIPGKTFEYIRVGRPILALVPPCSEVAQIIRESESGEVVSPDDSSAICNAIMQLYDRWNNGFLDYPTKHRFQLYDRRYLTKQLVSVFRQLA